MGLHALNHEHELKVLNSPYMFPFCRELSEFTYLCNGDKMKPAQLFMLSDTKGVSDIVFCRYSDANSLL